MVNLMITIQRKDYYRKSQYEEYSEEANAILSEYEKADKKSFGKLNEIFFLQEAKIKGKIRAGDQTPSHVFYIDEIFLFYPASKIIHMVRDPRAVLYSQKKKWMSGMRYKQPLFEIIRTFLNYHPVTMSLLWRKAVAVGLKSEKRYGNNDVLTLLFENLVSKPEFYIKKVCDFLDETFQPNMLDVSVELSATSSLEGKKGISKDVASSWRKGMSKTEIYICEKINKKMMEKLGYPLLRKRPNWLLLGAYAIWLPFSLGIAFFMNMGRMGNPLKYLSRRLFQNY